MMVIRTRADLREAHRPCFPVYQRPMVCSRRRCATENATSQRPTTVDPMVRTILPIRLSSGFVGLPRRIPKNCPHNPTMRTKPPMMRVNHAIWPFFLLFRTYDWEVFLQIPTRFLYFIDSEEIPGSRKHPLN